MSLGNFIRKFNSKMNQENLIDQRKMFFTKTPGKTLYYLTHTYDIALY